MRLFFSPLAEKQLKKLPKLSQIIIAKRVRSLCEGNLGDAKRLIEHKNFYRARAGNYRIVFRLSSSSIYVVILGHRKEVYKILDRLFK